MCIAMCVCLYNFVKLLVLYLDHVILGYFIGEVRLAYIRRSKRREGV